MEADFIKQLTDACEALRKTGKEIPSFENIRIIEVKYLAPGTIFLSPDLYEVVEKVFKEKDCSVYKDKKCKCPIGQCDNLMY